MECLKCVMKKKKEGLSRLLEIAGEKKSLLFLSGLLSAISALCALVPFWAIYEILKELLIHASDLSAIGSVFMVRWGWLAFVCKPDVFPYRGFPYFIRIENESFGASRTIVTGVSEFDIGGIREKDYGAECRENRTFHRPYHS